MKKYIVLFTIIVNSLLSAGLDSADKLVGAIQLAIDSRDAKAIESLVYDVGMTESDKKLAFFAIPDLFFNIPVVKIELASVGPEELREFYIHKGRKYSPTFKPLGKVSIHQKKDRFTGVGGMPYALINGKYFLVSVKSEDIGWNGPPDKNIGWMVSTFTPGVKNVRYRYNVSGVDMKDVTEYPSSSFWGQRIDEVIFDSISDDFKGYIVILENGKEVDKSGEFTGRGSFTYKPKHGG